MFCVYFRQKNRCCPLICFSPLRDAPTASTPPDPSLSAVEASKTQWFRTPPGLVDEYFAQTWTVCESPILKRLILGDFWISFTGLRQLCRWHDKAFLCPSYSFDSDIPVPACEAEISWVGFGDIIPAVSQIRWLSPVLKKNNWIFNHHNFLPEFTTCPKGNLRGQGRLALLEDQ